MTDSSIIVSAVVSAAQAVSADTSLIVDGALGAMCLLLVATFGLVWKLNEQMSKVYGAVFDKPFGVVAMLEKLVDKIDALESRVGDLERAD